MPEVVTSAGKRLKIQTSKIMLTPLETAAAENILKLIAGAGLRDAADVAQLAQAQCGIYSAASYRSNPYQNSGLVRVVDASQAVPVCGSAGPVPDTAPAETPAAAEPTTRAKRGAKAAAATPEPAPPTVDLGIGGSPEPAAAPAPAAPAPAAGPATKTYEEKCAEVKAAYVNKLRILTESNAAEGESFKDKVAAKITSLGRKKISDPGEENIDEFYSFLVNVVPDKGPVAPVIEV